MKCVSRVRLHFLAAFIARFYFSRLRHAYSVCLSKFMFKVLYESHCFPDVIG
jgi:hypothetical protein